MLSSKTDQKFVALFTSMVLFTRLLYHDDKMNIENTLYWYDLETFGIDPRYFRIAQFAGIRTDEELNIIAEPFVQYCMPPNDMLPEPGACLITGITPQKAWTAGISERIFIAKINKEFSRPNTCVVGYNNIRFDDEFIRYSLYRNFHDPYSREWKNGNSRWDIIDMVRLTRALRPEGIQWPNHEDGTQSFKLEDITKENAMEHQHSHDALSDVYATIGVAKLIRKAQPRLFDYLYTNKCKHRLSKLLDIRSATPVIHVSSMYPLERGCTAMVVPVARHPVNKNGIIVYDLGIDPGPLLELNVGELQHLIFTPKSELPENSVRIPLKTVHINKCPIIVPLNTLDKASAKRLGIDIQQGFENMGKIKRVKDLSLKIEKIYSRKNFESNPDPDYSLYSGFFGNADREKMDLIRSQSGEALKQLKFIFDDKRLPELLFRYRARNFPQSLSQAEKIRWEEHRKSRLTDENTDVGISMSAYLQQVETLLNDASPDSSARQTLIALKEYALQIMPIIE